VIAKDRIWENEEQYGWVMHMQGKTWVDLEDFAETLRIAADTAGMAMSIKGLPAGFIFPAQPVLRLKPPSGPDWVHEIKHDGYPDDRSPGRPDSAPLQP
jgi:hypothetical protein